MKKIWKLVIGGIETKIFNLILVTVILLTAVFAGITVYQSGMLTSLTAETGKRQQESTSAIISETMSVVTRSSMERTTDLEAEIADGMFRSIKARVMMVADYAGKIFADPDRYTAKPYAGPDASLHGKLVAQVLWADGVDPEDPANAARAGLAANLADLMISLCDATESDNVYIGFPEGFFLSVNRSSGDWFEDGKLRSYDARSRFWYRQAAEAGGIVFSDLEVDATTGELSVVCAVPVYGKDGELAAVVGSDLFLHAMENVVQGFVSDGGYSWIVNREGHVIYSPNPEIIQISSSAEAADLRESENRELAELVNDAIAGKADVRVVKVNGADYYMVGDPIETVGWTLFTAFPKDLVDQVEVSLLESYDQITNDARAVYQDKIKKSSHSSLILFILLTAVAFTAAVVVGKRIVKPLNDITRDIATINQQKPEFEMKDAYRTGDEIEVLAQSFAGLSHKTVEYVEEVKRVTAEKERIGTELNMAKRIQEGMLPNIFPAFPDRQEFDLYASMDPAREVGGDFYDFFLIDDDHLALVMADVSGKGVPGALFMMASKIILQSCAKQGGTPAEILPRANRAICSNNTMEMFVTVWLGILEISTGRLTAANAGHEYPMIKRADGTFEIFKDKHGFVIGGMDGIRYKGYELELHPGDKLFLYTDGVPEATDEEKKMFGTERMLKALNRHRSDTPDDILTGVREEVNDFVGDAEQFDDLTMLCLEYKGEVERQERVSGS